MLHIQTVITNDNIKFAAIFYNKNKIWTFAWRFCCEKR